MNTRLERLHETFKAVEDSNDEMMIDQLAFLVGRIPTNDRRREAVIEGHPKLAALMPEMEPDNNIQIAILGLSQYMDRADALGRAVTQLIKFLRGN